MFTNKSSEELRGIFVEIMAARFVSDEAISAEASAIITKNLGDISAAETRKAELLPLIGAAAAAGKVEEIGKLTAELTAITIPPTVTEEIAQKLAAKKLGKEFNSLFDSFVSAAGLVDNKVKGQKSGGSKTADFDKTAFTLVYKGETLVAARHDMLPEGKFETKAGDWVIRHGDTVRIIPAAEATSPSRLTMAIKESTAPQSKAWYNSAAELTAEAVAAML